VGGRELGGRSVTADAAPPRRASTLEHWESYWKGHADLDRTYSTGGRLSREIQADGDVRDQRVLEVGAGSGRDLLALARAGAIGIVLDYSPASLELVRAQAARLGVTVHLVRADALAMPFRDGALDVVFHQGLLEHFRDPLPLLKENARVTRRGGRVVVDVPQTFHLYTVMKNTLILFNAWFAGWETQFTPGALERCCRAAGLDVRRTYGEFLVPGLWYRVVRELLKRGAGWSLPLDPEGPRAWRRAWDGMRAALLRTRLGLHLAHVIGTVGEKP